MKLDHNFDKKLIISFFCIQFIIHQVSIKEAKARLSKVLWHLTKE